MIDLIYKYSVWIKGSLLALIFCIVVLSSFVVAPDVDAQVCVPGVTSCSQGLYCQKAATGYTCQKCPWGVFEVGLGDFVQNKYLKGESLCKYISINSTQIAGAGAGPFVNLVVIVIIALVVMAGMIVITFGGYLYMTAGGSGDRIGQAKTWISAGILGIVLALAAWTILRLISPTLI